MSNQALASNLEGMNQPHLDLHTSPEIYTGYRAGLQDVQVPRGHGVVMTANQYATDAAARILELGGSAADAAISAQLVLGLVEPQSSGLGGGLYATVHNSTGPTVLNYAIDGREIGPLALNDPAVMLDLCTGDPRGRMVSAGVPGVVSALALLHAREGVLAWHVLFEEPIRLAEEGFKVSDRLARSVAHFAEGLKSNDAAYAYLFPGGKPVAEGDVLRNPDYAQTLRELAELESMNAVQTFYSGHLACKIALETSEHISLASLQSYGATTGETLAYEYQPGGADGVTYRMLSPGRSAAGASTIFATLETLRGHVPSLPIDADGAHFIAEAERLAYADCDAIMGGWLWLSEQEKLFDSGYIARRRQLISDRPAELALPGDPLGTGAAQATPHQDEHGTTHFQIVDAAGRAVAVTSSVEAAFGNFHMVGGFFLNNQLSDFTRTLTPELRQRLQDAVDAQNVQLATDIAEAHPNYPAAGRRPRSSMAPMMVLGEDKRPVAVLGSPGGGVIIQYMVKALLALFEWGLSPQQACNMGNFGAFNNGQTWLGKDTIHPASDAASLVEEMETRRAELARELEQRGHIVADYPLASGLAILQRTDDGGWMAGIDPRREGAIRVVP